MRRANVGASVLSWPPCWHPSPLRYGGGSEPTPVGSERI